jgi:hypothetical protein
MQGNLCKVALVVFAVALPIVVITRIAAKRRFGLSASDDPLHRAPRSLHWSRGGKVRAPQGLDEVRHARHPYRNQGLRSNR